MDGWWDEPKVPVSTSGSGGLISSAMARGQEQTHAEAVHRAYDEYHAVETYFELGLGEAGEFVGEVVRAVIEGLREGALLCDVSMPVLSNLDEPKRADDDLQALCEEI